MHTGPVVIADGGEVFGETPNVAARVQSAAEPDTVVISAVTQRLVAGMFVLEDRGPQALKGVREPVVLYRVVQPSGVRSRLDIAADVGGRASFGRRRGPARRHSSIAGSGRRTARGRTSSSSAKRVWESRASSTNSTSTWGSVPHTWLECGATPYTEGTPFHPVIALVSRGLTFTPEDSGDREALASWRSVSAPSPPRRPRPCSPTSRSSAPDAAVAEPRAAAAEDARPPGAVEPRAQRSAAARPGRRGPHWCDVSTPGAPGAPIAQSPTARVRCSPLTPGVHASLAGALQPNNCPARPTHQAPNTRSPRRSRGRSFQPLPSTRSSPARRRAARCRGADQSDGGAGAARGVDDFRRASPTG